MSRVLLKSRGQFNWKIGWYCPFKVISDSPDLPKWQWLLKYKILQIVKTSTLNSWHICLILSLKLSYCSSFCSFGDLYYKQNSNWILPTCSNVGFMLLHYGSILIRFGFLIYFGNYVTQNIKFFKWSKLLHFELKLAEI
jgi:hypothetical protein